jgi:tetratricopeptide (TPR) repeat protein
MLAEPIGSPLNPSPRKSAQLGTFLATKVWVLFLITAALSILPHLPSLSFGFVYDDDAQIVQNPLLGSWRLLPNLFTQQSSHFLNPAVAQGYYRPIFLLWLGLNHHLFGLRPAGWHLTSVLLHGIISGLILVLLLRQGFPPWIATIAALFFGLHPVHIESVAWISGVTDPLACLFLLLSLLFWLGSRETASLLHFALSLSCFFIALLAKETAALFPLVILIYAWTLPRDPRARAERSRTLFPGVLQALPFFFTTGIYLALRRLALGAPFSYPNPLSLPSLVAAVPGLLSFYLRHLLWPARLSLFYDFALSQTFGLLAFWIPLLLIAAILCALLWLFHRWQDFSAFPALAWLFVPLSPVLMLSLLPKDDFLHDRYLYLPSVGASLLLAILLCGLFPHRRPRATVLLLFAACLGFMAVSTLGQSFPWRNNNSLFSHAYAIAPSNPNAQINLAVVLLEQKQYDRASNLLLSLLERDPNLWSANYNLGLAAYRQSDYATAEKYLRRSIALDPSRPDQFLYLGMISFHRNDPAEATALFRRAISLDPDGDSYHLALGTVLMEQRNFRGACEEFRHELRLNPDLPGALALLSSCEKHLQSGQ